MSSDPGDVTWAVRLDHVSKRYPRGGEPSYANLGSDLRTLGRRIARRFTSAQPPTPRGIVALDDISLTVERGESFGVIGPNGAGKSTLLRLISRITYPTSGEVRVAGRVGALMEVGSGIHPELTGRENIWLYGSILGLSRSQIRRRFDEIVEFAGLSTMVETQVKYYSSGMQLRLGFSIAAHLEPEVLIVDEALSVGDVGFQSRAVRRMRDIVREGATVLLVSHDLWSVEALCERSVLVDAGRMVAIGDTKEVLGTYLGSGDGDWAVPVGGHGDVRLLGASLHGADGAERNGFTRHEAIEIRLRLHAGRAITRPHVVVCIGEVECTMLDDDHGVPEGVSGDWECRLLMKALPLRPRTYEVTVAVLGEDGVQRLLEWTRLGAIRIIDAPRRGRTAVVNAYSSGVGCVVVEHEWAVMSGPHDDA